MIHLHQEKVIHRDLAARNILLSKHLEAKVSDFGLSRETQTVESGSVTSTAVGPMKWMAPEAILERKYSSKSDVFSFGVVVWEILTVSDPFPQYTAIEAAFAVTRGERLPIPQFANPSLIKVMKQCFEKVPEDRPDFEQIISFLDPYFSQPIDTPVIAQKRRNSHDDYSTLQPRPISTNGNSAVHN